jgi:cellulose biosynthesis protein BcsQ
VRPRFEELRQAFGELLWDPFVPTRAVLAEALGAGAPIHEYGSRARDAVYDALAQRLLTLTDED